MSPVTVILKELPSPKQSLTLDERQIQLQTNISVILNTGAQPKAGTGHKMQSVPVVFSRYVVRDISLTWDISRTRYFRECSRDH